MTNTIRTLKIRVVKALLRRLNPNHPMLRSAVKHEEPGVFMITQDNIRFGVRIRVALEKNSRDMKEAVAAGVPVEPGAYSIDSTELLPEDRDSESQLKPNSYIAAYQESIAPKFEPARIP